MRQDYKGRKCRIPKGTVIHGTFKDGSKIQGATRVVNLWAVDTWLDKSEVVWAGSGGYWHYANLVDVEILP